MGAGGGPEDEGVAAAQRGDPRALETLYETYAGRVLGYVRGLGVVDAEDVVSEVFVSVVRGLPTFRGDEADFRRWLFTIAHRRAVDSHRRHHRRREQATDPSSIPELVGPDHADDVDSRLSSSPATDALAQLTPDQREVILLRVVAELSVADAAEVLGKKPGAVKTLQRRALAALRRLVILAAVS